VAELGHRVTGIDLSEGMLADGRGIAAERQSVHPHPALRVIANVVMRRAVHAELRSLLVSVLIDLRLKVRWLGHA
jgi:hypothetical protein